MDQAATASEVIMCSCDVTAQGSIGGTALSRWCHCIASALVYQPNLQADGTQSWSSRRESGVPPLLEEWLLSLRPGAKTREERCCLVEKCAPASVAFFLGARQKSARPCLASVLSK